MENYIKGELLEILWLIIYIVLIIGIFSLFFGLGAGGFERNDILAKNNFYIPYGIIFLIGLIACKLVGLFYFSSNKKEYDGAFIHDSEQSIFKGFKIIKNPFLLSFFCFIFFGIIGYFASRYNTFFTAVPKYEQQFTPAADLFFSVYPASPSETLGALFLIALFGLILGIFVYRQKLAYSTFTVLFIIGGSLLSMAYGIINHLSRYGSSDIAMSSVTLFWLIGGLITTLTGSVIPFLIMHDINNFFYRFSKLFSSDVIAFTTFSVILLLTFLFLFVYIRKKTKKNET